MIQHELICPACDHHEFGTCPVCEHTYYWDHVYDEESNECFFEGYYWDTVNIINI